MSVIKQKHILDAQHSACPPEVRAEVRRMWSDYELRDNDYFNFDVEEMEGEGFPATCKFLKDQDLKGCLINYYW